jgi:DNA-binding response OmpR family regulator
VPPNYRALSIEDDLHTYEMIRDILGSLPLEVINAATGAEAIDFLTREIPDLILLDINLPDMSGWHVLDKFKNDERFTRSHIIILTSHKEPIHRIIGFLQPIALYLRKPFEPNELRTKVQQLLKL